MFSNSENDTIKFAKNFAATLKGGEVICLNGNLGAGKTTFMKGVAEYFNIDKNEITSPTFIIVNSFKIENFKIENLIHIDAYRIKNEDELLEMGILEFFNDKKSIVFIEWSENIKKYLTENIINIDIKILEKDNRELTII